MIGAGAAWMILAKATGLIFHLLPAGAPMLGGFLMRRSRFGGPVMAGIGADVVVSLVVPTTLAWLRVSLNDLLWSLVVVAVGAGIGWVLASRRGSFGRGAIRRRG